jgi:LacI family transcriptional regulator
VPLTWPPCGKPPRAGVPVGTVWYLSDHPPMAEATRGLVLAATEELDLNRDLSAWHGPGGDPVIAYVGVDAGSQCFTDVAGGIEAAAQEAGAVVFLGSSGGDEDRELRYLELMLELRVHGILVTPVRRDSQQLTDVRRRGTPIVLVDPGANGNAFCAVTVDNVLGGRLGVAHLLAAGRRRIAFIGGRRSMARVRDQHLGATQAIEAADSDPGDLIMLETQGHTVDEGRRAGERLADLRPSRRPSAVFCANDRLALGLLRELTRRGVNVPDDVAIVGYGDTEAAEAAAVTSVRPPRRLLGITAVDLFMEEAAARPDHTHRDVPRAPELVTRASTACPESIAFMPPRRGRDTARRRHRPPGPPWLTQPL